MKKKNIIIFLTFFFFVFFLFFTKSKVFGLEVPNYPSLPTGGQGIGQGSDLTQYLKYVFDFGTFIGFALAILSFCYAGILYILSPAMPSVMAEAKDRVSGTISGILILGLLYLIITTINPSLAIFHLTPLKKVETSTPKTPPSPGVYIYPSSGCSDDKVSPYTSSVDALGPDITNKIGSAKIVHDPNTGNAYVSILYENENFWGACQYISPDTSCHPAGPKGASASVHQYDFSPSGNGVYLYRKAFMDKNKDGGYLFISNSDISKIYHGDLTKLCFSGLTKDCNNINDCTVPKNEQDCAQYDKDWNCTKKKCPTLADDAVTSMKIDGNYIAVLAYDTSMASQSWKLCQEYPSSRDINKTGPEQIKWDQIRNNGKNPNQIIIIPVK